MSLLSKFENLVHRIALGIVTVVLVGLAVLTFVDVVGRYILSSPIPGTVEITEGLMAILMFGALAAATRSGEHIRVESLISGLKGKIHRFLEKVCSISIFIVVVATTWSLVVHIASLMETGDVTPVLRLPIYPFTMFACLMSLTAVIIALFEIFTLEADKEKNREKTND